ncbi:BON domain-containing protein [Chromohalobacter israelensis]|uniref:BON domain-containing protein n=1 Tax=Chromohalobacter israelensis TaxID=141390 RepID=UPI00265BCB60|nr:BON domain-containing protein [Chromohalobacter salexigens]MDO0944858.1 BON domain-containing protein [Chromohalobacter salexigens]
MNDSLLKQRVVDEIRFEPSIDEADIGVSVDEGVVTLSGHVATLLEKVNAEKAVRRVKGVRGIAEEIEVRPPGTHQTADDEIAKRILHILKWNSSIPDGAISVKVEKGKVSLMGRVEWNYQRLAALKVVQGLSGVTGITNQIEVKPHASSSDIQRRIEEAFKRDAELDAKSISVKVIEGDVTLEGRVRTWLEREAAERAAWSAPGVKHVEDHIAVN